MTHEETTNVVPDDATAETQNAPAQAEASELTSRLAELEKQVNDFREGWMRERADFANYKKRAEQQLRDSAHNAAVEALLALLPIIDDFDRAFSSVPAELQDNPWVSGVSGIQRKFQKLIDEQGITVIDPTGQPFDPTQHEAVGMEASDDIESGHVTTTLQKGYARGERVLRPAMVKVAS